MLNFILLENFYFFKIKKVTVVTTTAGASRVCVFLCGFYFCCHHRLQLFLFVFSQNYDMILAARTDADLKGRSENIGV